MISLLHLLHAIAAKRGDGIHPELRKRLLKMDSSPDRSNTAQEGVSESDGCRTERKESTRRSGR
jgi:hypothetical protein